MVEYKRKRMNTRDGSVRYYYTKVYKGGASKRVSKAEYMKKIGGDNYATYYGLSLKIINDTFNRFSIAIKEDQLQLFNDENDITILYDNIDLHEIKYKYGYNQKYGKNTGISFTIKTINENGENIEIEVSDDYSSYTQSLPPVLGCWQKFMRSFIHYHKQKQKTSTQNLIKTILKGDIGTYALGKEGFNGFKSVRLNPDTLELEWDSTGFMKKKTKVQYSQMTNMGDKLVNTQNGKRILKNSNTGDLHKLRAHVWMINLIKRFDKELI